MTFLKLFSLYLNGSSSLCFLFTRIKKSKLKDIPRLHLSDYLDVYNFVNVINAVIHFKDMVSHRFFVMFSCYVLDVLYCDVLEIENKCRT
jgi:hypothetical protein